MFVGGMLLGIVLGFAMATLLFSVAPEAASELHNWLWEKLR